MGLGVLDLDLKRLTPAARNAHSELSPIADRYVETVASSNNFYAADGAEPPPFVARRFVAINDKVAINAKSSRIIAKHFLNRRTNCNEKFRQQLRSIVGTLLMDEERSSARLDRRQATATFIGEYRR